MPADSDFATAQDRCPLCGQTNQCAMQIEKASGVRQPTCWCTELKFSPELLNSVPAEARNRTCICQRCATAESAA